MMSIHDALFSNRVMEILLIAIIIMVVPVSWLKASESIYFISGQPGTNIIQEMPFPIIIYRLDIINNSLIEVWSTSNNEKSENILNLTEVDKLIIQDKNGIFKIFNYSDIPNYKTFDLGHIAPISSSCYYLRSKDNSGVILVRSIASDPTKRNSISNQLYDINTGNEIIINEKNMENYDLKLSGITPPLGNGTHNICGIQIDSAGQIISGIPTVNIDKCVIPKDLIQTHSPRGWNIIANGDNYLAILAVPDKHGLVDRELLIYNKAENKWNSILIPGARTAPTIVNNYLAGIIAEFDPETDFENGKGFPPILSDSTVIINPLTTEQFTVILGDNSEVLWIDNSTAYYRVDDSLFTAKIQDNGFVNRQLLLTDDKIRHIHWAFESKSGPIKSGEVEKSQ